ncbi:SMI1/KNR4 family protein [Streptomyces alboniger]|uniref:SMI1/KNR4 family protein n=1 Tax=Streptomyces alboniger TaxID=132473 RepID=A0A5J6HM60_STRAD|nr:SMI1/KNR4 family protein [Streptomyces alboniger]QEV19604.1 SMI1/KNR4 family protein [Streptomyces alboniger]
MTDTEQLLARVAAEARATRPWGWDVLPAPVDADTLARAEAALGFRLPPLLAALYTRIGDGGFGPEYGLLPLLENKSSGGEPAVVEKYLAMRHADDWGWPEGVLPISQWGCGMYACVDCRTDSAQVLLFEPNGGDPDHAWFIDSPSLTAWLTAWLDGTGWYEEDNQGLELPSWHDAQARVAHA